VQTADAPHSDHPREQRGGLGIDAKLEKAKAVRSQDRDRNATRTLSARRA
jgi:hypothetical protein